MTTVACNREEIAADSLYTSDDTVIGMGQKLFRIGPDVVAVAGLVADVRVFVDWYRASSDYAKPAAERPQLSDDFGALVLTSYGIVEFDSNLRPLRLEREYAAMGSGWEVALGAMHAGATPEEAVRIACEVNVYTGGPVVVERLEEGGK